MSRRVRQVVTATFLLWLCLWWLPSIVPAADKPGDLVDPPELKPLKYRSIGPAWGGRISRVAGVPGDPSIYYAATAGGGVWKSVNGGTLWKPVFDDQPVSSIGSIAIASSDPNVIYVGSGEANIRGNVAAGNGIYKSIDGGKTWTHVWKQEGQIGTMAVHPSNADIAFAAVLGRAFGPNAERGLYRTKDGGKTWQQVLKKDENSGASDVALDPSNPNIVFAGLWQTRRTPWDLTSGGPGSGLYVSRDGGDSWQQLKDKGLPDGPWGKIGVAVAPSDGRRVYVLIEAGAGGLYRSDDGGENWKRASANRLLQQRAWYYSTMAVHPSNPNEIWCPQVPMVRSIDGGENFAIMKGFGHGDHHDLWFDPKNPKRMIAGNDGGVDISLDGGETWFTPALPIAQFYHVTADNRVPFHVAGAMQDIGTAQGPSRGLSSRGIRNSEWVSVGGGEAGHVVSDPSDPNIVYAGEYGGYISRYDHRVRHARNVGIYPEDPSGHGAEDMKYRFQWTAPIAISPHDPKTVYHGANVLFRTTDAGQTWTAISPDLTRNDKSKQKWSGGPITGDNTGVETYCTIFAVAESPLQRGLLWVGSDDGLVHVSRDGGKNWKNVTSAMPGFPEWGTVSIIEPSHFDAGTAFVVVDAHRLDNTHPYLYRTADFGESWQRLDSGLPQHVYLHSVREDTKERKILYLGTERGVAFSSDGGATWYSLKLNLPTVAVHDLAVKDDSLVLATHGRSLWILDHLSAVRAWTPALQESAARLLPIPDAIRWRMHPAPADRWTGENPPGLGYFYYWLKEAPKGEVVIEVLDAQGAVIRKLSSIPADLAVAGDNPADSAEAAKKATLPKEAGVNAAPWDLSYDGAEMIPAAKLDAGNPAQGPMALPGAYKVRLKVDGSMSEQALRILPDPRVQVTDADLRAQLTIALSIRAEITRLTRAVNRLRSVRRQLAERNDLLKIDSRAAALRDGSSRLIAGLGELERMMHNPTAEVVYDILAMKGGAKLYSRLSYLFDTVKDADGAPTQGIREVLADQKKELDSLEAQLAKMLDADLAALNTLARELDLPHIVK